MSLFKFENQSLKEISEKEFKKEKQLQQLVENNLSELLNLEFVSSEFPIKNFRLDTLAFNKESNSFVIIEYKKSKNQSLVDQGYSYLNTMIDQKAAFVLVFNEKFPESIKKISDIDWSQSRIIFISPLFSTYQIGATSNPDLPIDLIQVKSFDHNIIQMEEITKSHYMSNDRENLTSVNKLNKEIQVYTEEKSLERVNEDIQELYFKIKETILDWDPNIRKTIQRHYIAFKLKTNFCDIKVQKASLKIWVNSKYGKLEDPKNRFRNVSNVGHYGNGDYEIKIMNDEEIEYVLSVIKQEWKRSKKD